MAPKAYQSYLKALNSGDAKDFDTSVLNSNDNDTCMFTIKNYEQPTGLSFRFFEQIQDEYEVMGPMGKGLSVESSGLHIAFAGGTGALTFVDLVAHIALKNLGLIDLKDNVDNAHNSVNESSFAKRKNDFKFILYASF